MFEIGFTKLVEMMVNEAILSDASLLEDIADPVNGYNIGVLSAYEAFMSIKNNLASAEFFDRNCKLYPVHERLRDALKEKKLYQEGDVPGKYTDHYIECCMRDVYEKIAFNAIVKEK